ncbi:hypothetical protein L0F63_000891 [Massospora cicadina]|nr:hypothetical protein L0F63_000891 [Massospora cicadina]
MRSGPQGNGVELTERHPSNYEEVDRTCPRSERKAGPKKLWLVVLALSTAYLVASLVVTPNDRGWRLAIYFFILVKVLSEFVPVNLVIAPVRRSWKSIGEPISRVPGLIKGAMAGFFILSLALVLTYGFQESVHGTNIQRSQSLLGVLVFLAIMSATSRNFKLINWHTVATGVLLQLVLGLFAIKTQFGANSFVASLAPGLLEFSSKGCAFIVGQELVDTKQFAFVVLPGILFFASFVQVLYYLGVMQWIITRSAWFFKLVMDTTVCESLAATASPFVGMGDSALLVKPYLREMTRSELHQVMTSGSLITSCIMSIPCSLALSKMRYPETEESRDEALIATDLVERETNILHAAANGAAQGVTLCLLISGTLLAAISLLALTNAVLNLLGFYVGYGELSLELVGSYMLWPFAWLVGVPTGSCLKVGSLLATKLFSNEFVAYKLLLNPTNHLDNLDPRSTVLATYALCGFANFASIGIQVGGLGALVPNRKRDLTELAFSAMVTGTACTFVSAAIAGILI